MRVAERYFPASIRKIFSELPFRFGRKKPAVTPVAPDEPDEFQQRQAAALKKMIDTLKQEGAT